MEKLNAEEQKRLIDELIIGKELTNQLKSHLGSVASNETRENLVQKILSSYDKALAVLINCTALLQQTPPAAAAAAGGGLIESPNDQSFDGVIPKNDHFSKDVYKKRKILPRWSEHVRVCSATGVDGPMDDGHSWRKYGQKDILGANHPRAYYRCTHKFTKCCVATKQVQRSDEDPSMFEVTYRGKHTCIQSSQLIENEKMEGNKAYMQKISQEMKVFEEGLRVKNEDFDTPQETLPSFSFPSTPIESEDRECPFFSEPLHAVLRGFNYSFISSEDSESKYFHVSDCLTNNLEIGGDNWQSLESELNELPSALTSVTNSDLDFSIDLVNFGSDFSLENCSDSIHC